MRTISLHCYSCVLIGTVARDAYSYDYPSQLVFAGAQDPYLIYMGIAQGLLAIGLFVGLVNLLGREDNTTPLGIAVPKQLVSQPLALGILSLFLVILSLTQLPTLPLLVFAALIGALSWTGYRLNSSETELSSSELNQLRLQRKPSKNAILKIELGSSLLCLASPNVKGNLVDKIPALRVAIREELGLTIPSIRVKDNLNLPAHAYRIYVRNGIVAEGIVYKDRFMIVLDEFSDENLQGIREREPVFGMSAIWVTEEECHSVGDLFVHAMDPVTVVLTHLSNIVEKYADELLTREAVAEMVEELRQHAPKLVGPVMGNKHSISRMHHILKSLLSEQVPVKDLATIVETATDWNHISLEDCVEKIRTTLRRQICANVATTGEGGGQVIRCVELPASVEFAVSNKQVTTVEFTSALTDAATPLLQEGLPIVVVSSNASRSRVRAQVVGGTEHVIVLGKDEIVPEVELQIVGTVEPECVSQDALSLTTPSGDKHHIIAYAQSLLGDPVRPSAIDRIETGIVEITNMVEEVLGQEASQRLSPIQISVNQELIEQGFSPQLATDIINAVKADSRMCQEELQSLVTQEILRRMPQVIPPPMRETSKPTIIALVGPTGVGKTTTIAKLATRFGLQQGRRVVLVTADTYRVAAVDQLRHYAHIFDAQLEIASSAVEMSTKIASLDGTGVVLIDTAGRSAADEDRIQETARVLQSARPDETHLVLSAATSVTASQRAISSFAPTGYDRVIVTKLDETVANGEILTTLCALKVPVSWFTDGQDISTHLEVAKPSRIVNPLFEMCPA